MAWMSNYIPEKNMIVLTWVKNGIMLLTHWARDKIAAISQTTSSNAFSWMKMYEFRLRFPWSLFLRIKKNIGSDNGLAPTRRQAIFWTNDG